MTERMAEMQKIINAENGDLFDVLVHVVYASPGLTPRTSSSNCY